MQNLKNIKLHLSIFVTGWQILISQAIYSLFVTVEYNSAFCCNDLKIWIKMNIILKSLRYEISSM